MPFGYMAIGLLDRTKLRPRAFVLVRPREPGRYVAWTVKSRLSCEFY
jgi:hypothetical protein